MSAATAYTVVGGGAIGGTIAHALARAGHPVTVVDTDTAHVEAIRARGLAIRRDRVGGAEGLLDIQRLTAAFTPSDAPDEPLGIVLLATKSQHTRQAAAWVAKRLDPDGVVVSVQNGRNEPAIAEHVGADRTLGAFVDIFADYVEPGVIRYGGHGALVVGLPDGGAPDRRVLEIAEDLRAYPGTIATANLPGYRWSKRAFASILGFTSLVDAPLAETIDQFRDVAGAVAAEPTALALAAGVTLEAFDAYEPYAFTTEASARVRDAALDRLIAWLRTQPKDRSGGFRDIAVRRRPRETASGPDEGAEIATRFNIATPLAEAINRQLTEIESGRRCFSVGNVQDLRDVLQRTGSSSRSASSPATPGSTPASPVPAT